MPAGRPKKQKTLPVSEGKASATRKSGSIVSTDSWLNRKGNAVYLNIPESDIRLTVGTDGKKRISFITSVTSLDDLVKGYRLKDGEKKSISGVNLGRFPD